MPRGSVYGFLGPNGSGKTTTIRMLLGLAFPTSGSAQVLGVDMPDGAVRVLSRVGSLVEGPAFYPYLSGWDNLARYDAADGSVSARTAKARIGTALDRVGLTAAAKKKFRNYSLGMKQRLAIAAALLTPRDLIVLDEPTNGLDPQGTREVRTLVRQIAADGITVFVSSHLLAEVEQVSTHVGVMRTGKLVFQGELAALRRTAAPRDRGPHPGPDGGGRGAEEARPGRPGRERRRDHRRTRRRPAGAGHRRAGARRRGRPRPRPWNPRAWRTFSSA